MKILNIAAMILCLLSPAAVAICIFTDWNDGLYLPLGLCLSVAGNALNILSDRRGKGGKENAK